MDRKRLAERIVAGVICCGFSYGQLCPRRIGQNPFELLCFCVLVKLDLCHLDRPYLSRTRSSRVSARELLLPSIAVFLSL
jgi:hypothetical protein